MAAPDYQARLPGCARRACNVSRHTLSETMAVVPVTGLLFFGTLTSLFAKIGGWRDGSDALQVPPPRPPPLP